MDIFAVISLLGGLGMFLYGMEIMGNSLKRSSGKTLKKVLGKLTQNAFFGLLTGMLVTAVIQSSHATIVLTVGLISAGILNLRQAVSIVLGANIGTTVTAQIIRLMDIDSKGSILMEFFKPSTLAPLALIVGIILWMFVKKNGAKGTGEIFLGVGVLFSGLLSMTAAVTPLAQSQVFVEILSKFSDIPVLGILVGLVVTVILQSSSATVGILQALSVTGVMTFNLIYPVIMGINLGTCVTSAVVCSIGSVKDAKRVGIVHIVFNCIGTALFMLAMTILQATGAFPGLWEKIVNSGDIANFQTLFNLVTAAVLLPFTGALVKLSYVIVKPSKKKAPGRQQLPVFDEKLLVSPAFAMAEAYEAVGKMGQAAKANLDLSYAQMLSYDKAVTEEILECEDDLDRFADSADNFLVALSKHVETDEDNTQLNMIMQTVPNFERLGDYATNIDELALRMIEEKITFSDQAKAELRIICSAVENIVTLTTEAFVKNDNEMAKKVEPLEEVIDDMVVLLKRRHIERLKAGTCTVGPGLVFMELLTYLERAADQCSSIALLMLGRENEEILHNHHEYLRELHKGGDMQYSEELNRRREQYVAPLEQI